MEVSEANVEHSQWWGGRGQREFLSGGPAWGRQGLGIGDGHGRCMDGYVRSGRGRLRQGAETRATGQNHKWSNNPARDAGWGNGDRGRQDCGGHGGLVTGRPTRAGAGVGELQLVSCPDSELDPRDGGWLYTPFLSSLSTSG